MIKIKLTQDAYLAGYEGAFCREYDSEGNPLITGLWNNWYEAGAEDSDGNEYTVLWELRDDYDITSEEDENNACDWDNPWMILDEDGCNVVESVILSNEVLNKGPKNLTILETVKIWCQNYDNGNCKLLIDLDEHECTQRIVENRLVCDYFKRNYFDIKQ